MAARPSKAVGIVEPAAGLRLHGWTDCAAGARDTEYRDMKTRVGRAGGIVIE